MQYFPLFADLKGRAVLLVGAGEVATRKAESLLQAGADIRVVARELAPAFLDWQNEGRIQWLAREFHPTHLQDVFLVVSATGDAEVDSQVFKAAQARHLLCNTVDDPQRCSFITPAVIDRSPIQVAISSSGTSPVLIRHWRQRIEALLPQHTGTLADIAGRWRTRVQERLGTVRDRRHFWETLFASRFDALVAQGDIAAAEAELARQLDGQAARQGEVVVVHADPCTPCAPFRLPIWCCTKPASRSRSVSRSARMPSAAACPRRWHPMASSTARAASMRPMLPSACVMRPVRASVWSGCGVPHRTPPMIRRAHRFWPMPMFRCESFRASLVPVSIPGQTGPGVGSLPRQRPCRPLYRSWPRPPPYPPSNGRALPPHNTCTASIGANVDTT